MNLKAFRNAAKDTVIEASKTLPAADYLLFLNQLQYDIKARIDVCSSVLNKQPTPNPLLDDLPPYDGGVKCEP